jgi:hypothetical protein
MAIKPSDITKEMVEERSKIIIEALIENNILKLNLAIKQLANWSAAKRKQVFRKTFLQLIGGRQYWQPLARTLKANYYVDYWASPLDITMNTLLERFVSEIRKLEETSRFIPEKVLTLSSVSLRILNMDANTFKYLIDKKIWIIGNSLKLTSFIANFSISLIFNSLGSFPNFFLKTLPNFILPFLLYRLICNSISYKIIHSLI